MIYNLHFINTCFFLLFFTIFYSLFFIFDKTFSYPSISPCKTACKMRHIMNYGEFIHNEIYAQRIQGSDFLPNRGHLLEHPSVVFLLNEREDNIEIE